MYQMHRVTEALRDMKTQYDEEKRLIHQARNDLNSVTSLLTKVYKLPILSGPEIKDEQLAKLVKEIQNYSVITSNLATEINTYDQQLEDRRRNDLEKELTMEMFHKLHGEVRYLFSRRETLKNMEKTKQDSMTSMVNSIQIHSMDAEFIQDRLETRSKLFQDYMRTNNGINGTTQQIAQELGNHVQEIRTLTHEFLNFDPNVTQGEYMYEQLKKIKEKEHILDNASYLLKKYYAEDAGLRQLFDAIRLNNVSHIFELTIDDFHKTYQDLTDYKVELVAVRSEIREIEDRIWTKERELHVILAKAKEKDRNYPTNCTVRELLEYFTILYNTKKESHHLKSLGIKIKHAGIEVIQLCRKVISFQEKQNQKLSAEISLKTEVIKTLERKFTTLQNERHLQLEVEHLLRENRQLLFMNAVLMSHTPAISDNPNWMECLQILETQHTPIIEENLTAVTLRHEYEKLRKYVAGELRNLLHIQTTSEDDSDDESSS